MSSEGFSALEKNARDISSEGCAAHPVEYNSPLQIKMDIWRTFLNLNLQGRAWKAAAFYNGCLASFKFKKKCANGNNYRQRAAKPNQITQQNSFQQAGGP
jgi:hypothetical protein